MRKNNFKLQILAENRLKICVSASSQISTTLVIEQTLVFLLFVTQFLAIFDDVSKWSYGTLKIHQKWPKIEKK